MSEETKSKLYRDAGVDIDLAQNLLVRVKRKISSTGRPEVLAPIGGFGGLFQIDLSKYREPVLVSSIDGVGTKLAVAMMMEKFDTVGHDIVNHCVNDIAVQGAEPLYFMDYIGIGKLRSPLFEHVLAGIADACLEVGCSVLGGETAEMPGMYGNDFDLVGVITGVVEKSRLITGKNIKPGHAAIGIASNGLHTNGFSLARKILFEKCGYQVDSRPALLDGVTVGEALLEPHLCYWRAIKQAMESPDILIDGMAHITGGGLYDNVPRIIPSGTDVEFCRDALPVPPVFRLIVEKGDVDTVEAYRVFNMGIGMVWFVPAEQAGKAIAICRDCGFNAAVCGKVVSGGGNVRVL